MRIFTLTMLLLFFLSGILKAQIAITPEQEKAFKNEAKKWVDTYGSNLNNIGSSYLTVFDKTEVIEDIIKQFENDNVIVTNDLDLTGTTPKDFKVRQHLGNIISWFTKDGVSFAFKNVKLSDVFFNKNDNSLFVKVEIDRDINGVNVYNKPVTNTSKLDFYVKYVFQNNQILPKPMFYSITEHIENLNNFTKVQVTTKTEGTIKISDDRKEIDAVVNAAKAKQEEIKKKIEEADRKKAESIAKAEAAKLNQKKYEEAKNMSMLGFNVYLSKLYNGEFHVSISKSIISYKYFVRLSVKAEGGAYFKVPSQSITKHDKFTDAAYINSTDRLAFGSGLNGKAGLFLWVNKVPVTFGLLMTSEKQNWDPNQSTKYFIQREARGWQLVGEFKMPFLRKLNYNKTRKFINYFDFYISYNRTTYVKYSAVNFAGATAPVPDKIFTKTDKLKYYNLGIKCYIPLYF